MSEVKYWVREYPDGHNCFCDNPEIVAVAPSTWKPLFTAPPRVVDVELVKSVISEMEAGEHLSQQERDSTDYRELHNQWAYALKQALVAK